MPINMTKKPLKISPNHKSEVTVGDKKTVQLMAQVVTTHEEGNAVVEHYPVTVTIGTGNHANVGYQATFAMGEYNKIKVQVSLYMPCKPVEQHINETFKFVQEWVDEKMGEVEAKMAPGT